MADLTDISERTVWPSTPDARRRERQRRIDAALGLDYTGPELTMLGAFAATNPSGEIIHRTRRISGAGRFVTQVDAAALASNPTIDLTDDARSRIEVPIPPVVDGDTEGQQRAADAVRDAAVAARLDRATRIWRRSHVDDLVESWGWLCAAGGDILLEVVDDPGGVRFVAHYGDRYDVLYDRYDSEVASAEIRMTYTEADADGLVTSHEYRRLITAASKRTWIDGAEGRPLPHALGVPPVVHVAFKRAHDPSLGIHAAHGTELAQVALDSIATQFIVLGTRAANPAIVVLGALLKSADGAPIDKVFNLPETGDMKWLEPAMSGLQALRDLAADIRANIEREFPEYLFVDSGASSSGTALSYRAGAFKAKIEPVQRRFWNGIARAIGMCIAMEDGVPYDAEVHDVYVVTGGPALPEDRSGLADLLIKLIDADLIRVVDVVAALQASGVLPSDRSAEDYLADVEREAGPRREANAQIVAGAFGGGREVDETDPAKPAADTTPAPTGAAPPDAAAAEPWNGSQLESALEIIAAVGAARASRESGKALFEVGMHTTPEEAERLLGPASFDPATPEPGQPAIV